MSYKQYILHIEEEWDDYWNKTSIKNELELTKTDGLLPIFEKYLPRSGEILEAGCGLGKWVIVLTRKGYKIVGLDNNRYAIDALKNKYPKLKVRIGDVQKLSFKDEEFDTYISLGVVEHFEEGPQIALEEAYRVLKKGGTAIVEVPFDSPLRKLTRLLSFSLRLMKTPIRLLFEYSGIRKKRNKIRRRFYEYRYTTKELKIFMQQAGFSEISVLPKDDLSPNRSISLWLDYLKLQNSDGNLFELNSTGKFIKGYLNKISPFTYCALIVAVAKKL